MQPCKTGDQPYSDASPNGECSLVTLKPTRVWMLTEDPDSLCSGQYYKAFL